jgi:hypothetical protein
LLQFSALRRFWVGCWLVKLHAPSPNNTVEAAFFGLPATESIGVK